VKRKRKKVKARKQETEKKGKSRTIEEPRKLRRTAMCRKKKSENM
jgi:hypothetical protein